MWKLTLTFIECDVDYNLHFTMPGIDSLVLLSGVCLYLYVTCIPSVTPSPSLSSYFLASLSYLFTFSTYFSLKIKGAYEITGLSTYVRLCIVTNSF
jgi:hypothetical protein